LPKPFTRRELLVILRKWIDGDALAATADERTREPARVITAAMSARASPALDPAVLASLRSLSADGGEALVVKLAQIFRDDAQLRRDQLRRAFDESSAELLRSAAHAFKSSSANMGARALAEICRQIETQTLGGDIPEACASLLVELEHEYARVDHRVTQILATTVTAVEQDAA